MTPDRRSEFAQAMHALGLTAGQLARLIHVNRRHLERVLSARDPLPLTEEMAARIEAGLRERYARVREAGERWEWLREEESRTLRC